MRIQNITDYYRFHIQSNDSIETINKINKQLGHEPSKTKPVIGKNDALQIEKDNKPMRNLISGNYIDTYV